MAKKKAPAKKAAAPPADKRIAQLRKQLNEALADPKFADMSEAFRKSVAERMGVEKMGPGNVLESKLSAAGMARPYYNIYRYRFW
jgi:UDP:flavonoid glycosyltransferase YjiC (YdhE family)